uniref:Uncharacterized protein n=1 Tax=Glyptapanteles flavicoxis TaxID=463051 RepID=B7S851_9HYME|nr:conserved hypothetical protein [Glyptapanteles flavicoxis]
MMVIKTVLILWVAISSATCIETTSEEDTVLREGLETDLFSPKLRLNYNRALYDENGAIEPLFPSIIRVEFSSTPRPEQVSSLVAPSVHPEAVTHPTSPLVPNSVPNPPQTPAENLLPKTSTSPPPSSTTDNVFPKQLLPPSHATENRPSEETPFTEMSTTEDSIFKGKSSSATDTVKDFVLEELTSLPTPLVEEKITSKKIEPPTGVLSIEIIIAGFISANVLLIVLLIIIKSYCLVCKTTETNYEKLNEHSHIVYQNTVEKV